jgi:hypothetical protein
MVRAIRAQLFPQLIETVVTIVAPNFARFTAKLSLQADNQQESLLSDPTSYQASATIGSMKV